MKSAAEVSDGAEGKRLANESEVQGTAMEIVVLAELSRDMRAGGPLTDSQCL